MENEKKPTILIVDDARDTRELLRLHLTDAGYAVEEAEDALVAGRRVLAAAPDLIITDVRMPYMTGTEFVSALRADPAIPDIPVIFLTAYDPAAAEAGKLRAAACLSKPVSLDRLLEVVSLYLPAAPCC